MVVGRLFLAVPRGCLPFVIVVFPDHTHLLFLMALQGRATQQSYYYIYSLNCILVFKRTVSSRLFLNVQAIYVLLEDK